MAIRRARLAAARRHGRRALTEIRHLSADAALHWVLSHRTRVARFRRAVSGTRAAPVLDALLAAIHAEATALARPRPRRRRVARRPGRVRRARTPRWLEALAAHPLAI